MKEEKVKTFENILRKHSLKVTHPRLKVLEKIFNKDTATSQPELEKSIGEDIDRVTLYRVLNIFEEKGIIHKVFDLHGTATYAICSTRCTTHQHHDEHVHFTCSTCNSVYCLQEIKLPQITTPSGFTIDQIAVNAIGTCNKCQSLKNASLS
ncbi:Fur family transcriptional regulator [Olivibacter domesticus]|uniref:Fur family transcriptional regulator, ferric uptake regulator n=1 Tax=Olivibacter domesticus TaxID=407022 RepID=A0A1H7PNK4_OLID1|nr:transcriptional repressor [Olivibacter domesticus]SEL36974.1 Fur family transcriptional regulator, ferric uptake regulator [Olivibacter domesticus]